jgi:hypothetical protein
MDVYGHVYNLDSLLHVSSNMLPPTNVTIAPSGLSHVVRDLTPHVGRIIYSDVIKVNINKA